MPENTTYMAMALTLAKRAAGHVEPNPMVGCVLVRDGAVVGRGYHQRYGGQHAEANALAAAGSAARGATCYVTLEPCCHHGKTPPCTDALIAAGVTEVVAACEDPFEPVGGRGIQALAAAGIHVRVGLLDSEARRLNCGYFKLRRTGRPLVTLKWAQSVDGAIATGGGDSKWISGEASRRLAHLLRRRSQAVLVGVRTVLADDPLLTARAGGGRQPLRVVADSRLRIPADSQLVRTARDTSVLVATTAAGMRGQPAKVEQLQEAGAEVIALADDDGDRVSLAALLDLLGRRQITHLLVEGGGQIHGAMLDAGLADRVVIFISPRIIGGSAAVRAVGGRGVSRIGEAISLCERRIRGLGDDLVIEADLRDLTQW